MANLLIAENGACAVIPAPLSVIPAPFSVIPAEAGIQVSQSQRWIPAPNSDKSGCYDIFFFFSIFPSPFYKFIRIAKLGVF